MKLDSFDKQTIKSALLCQLSVLVAGLKRANDISASDNDKGIIQQQIDECNKVLDKFN